MLLIPSMMKKGIDLPVGVIFDSVAFILRGFCIFDCCVCDWHDSINVANSKYTVKTMWLSLVFRGLPRTIKKPQSLSGRGFEEFR